MIKGDIISKYLVRVNLTQLGPAPLLYSSVLSVRARFSVSFGLIPSVCDADRLEALVLGSDSDLDR